MRLVAFIPFLSNGWIMANMLANDFGMPLPSVRAALPIMRRLSQPVLDSNGQDCTQAVTQALERLTAAVVGHARLIIETHPITMAGLARLEPAQREKALQNTELGIKNDLSEKIQTLMLDPAAVTAFADLASADEFQNYRGAEALALNQSARALFSTLNQFNHAVRTPTEKQALLSSFQAATDVVFAIHENAEGADIDDLAEREAEVQARRAARQQFGLEQPIHIGRAEAVGLALSRLARSEGLSSETFNLGLNPIGPATRAALFITGRELPEYMIIRPMTMAQLFLNPALVTSRLPRMPSTTELVREMLRQNP
jgi:hypothetical protein